MRAPSVLISTRPADSTAWMRWDLLLRLAPFTLLVAAIQLLARPAWLGLGPGRLRPLPPARALVLDGRAGHRPRRPAPGAGVLAPAGPAVPAGREPGPLRRHLRLSRPGTLAPPKARAAGTILSGRQARVLGL